MVGNNFEIGEKLTLTATPMVGGVFGNTTGVAPGYLAGITWKRLELSTEGEYVFDTKDGTGSFFYSWIELSYSPREWCRAGIVAQRTKAYHISLDIQRGLLMGLSHQQVNFTTYLFNAGWTDPTVVLSVGFNFSFISQTSPGDRLSLVCLAMQTACDLGARATRQPLTAYRHAVRHRC